MDESGALRRAGWAGAASVVLLAVGVTLGALVGVDAPGMSDATVLGRIEKGGRADDHWGFRSTLRARSRPGRTSSPLIRTRLARSVRRGFSSGSPG